MKVISDQGILVDLLVLVSGVIVTRTPKPVLTCVKLAAHDGKLTLSATDMEVAIKVHSAKVDITEEGEALIPADKFSQIVRASLDPTITLKVEEDVTYITGQDSKFKIFGYPVNDFPPIPEFEGEADFEIAASELHRLIRQTIFATSRENSRFAFSGVLIERDGNKLSLVATDGRRLALSQGRCKALAGNDHSVIVPTKALHSAMRVFDNTDDAVKIQLSDNQIIFANDDATLAANLVEGNFPPYQDVIPKDGDRRATLATETLVHAVRRAALLTNDESKGIKLSFSVDGIVLSSRAPEMGEAEINVQMPTYEGESIAIGFNPNFILEALKVVETDEVTIDMKAPNKPGVMKSGPDFIYVIMPVNLQ